MVQLIIDFANGIGVRDLGHLVTVIESMGGKGVIKTPPELVEGAQTQPATEQSVPLHFNCPPPCTKCHRIHFPKDPCEN